MPLATALTHAIGCELPIIQAPMGGANATPPELVAAVSEAGGLGFIGAAYMSPAEIGEVSRAVRALTSRPFGINLFAPTPPPAPADAAPAIERLAPYHAELALPAPALPGPPAFTFADQLAAALESGAAAFSFTFGLLPPDATAAVKACGMYLMGTATTVEEALLLERDGVDAVVAQGSEAGAHRGTFTGDFDAAMIGTVALVPQVADAVSVPVVASGGIMDGRGIAAALALGAAGVQMGTAFLTTEEAGITEAHKAAILGTREDRTRVTRAFSGRPARGIVNRFMLEVEGTAILPYPLQNALTRPLRNAAAAQGRADLLSLWAGQGLRLARREPAADLIARLATDTEAHIRRLAAMLE
ncbi:MAG TPA: nitronate monooxygenase [Longimicrobiales bacterium]|nr:nitronate monooxygenase [Longimicrobiales bacterium]